MCMVSSFDFKWKGRWKGEIENGSGWFKKRKEKLKGLERKSVGTVTSIRYAWAVDVFSMCRVKAQQDIPGWLCASACPSYAHHFSIAGSH